MRHSRTIWLTFALAVTVAAGGMVWMTRTALELDRREAEAQRHNEDEELIRLTLWRMDAAMMGTVLAESGRPYLHYQSFFATARTARRLERQLTLDRYRFGFPIALS